MQTLIRLKIEKFIEAGQEYFVANSDDLQGLVAEGKTVKKAIEIAEDVALSTDAHGEALHLW